MFIFKTAGKGQVPAAKTAPKDNSVTKKGTESPKPAVKNDDKQNKKNDPAQVKKNAVESRRDSSVSKKGNESKDAKNVKNVSRKSKVPDKENVTNKKESSSNKPVPAQKSVKDDTQNIGVVKNSSQPENKEENEANTKKENVKTDENNASNKNGDVLQNGEDPKIIDTQKETVESKSTQPKAQVSENTGENNEKPKIKRRDSTLVQRPGSARPESRRLVRNDSQNVQLTESGSPKEKISKKMEEVRPSSAIRPRTAARPPSARPGAPRIRDRGEVSVADEIKGSPNIVNVIEEGKQDHFADDKDNFIVIESEQTSIPQMDETPEIINEQEQGQLVHQILKTQKELNESVAVDTQSKHLEIEWDTGRQRERDLVTKEVDKIRVILQALTSAANPLGKLFDFLQEDVDEMQRELQHWKTVNENLHKQQLTEVELRKSFLQPLQKQLEEVEINIQEEHAKISNIKSTILTNDEKILRLVTGTKVRPK